MKTILKIGLIVGLALLLFSCVEDDSSLGTNSISEISVEKGKELDTLYVKDKGLTLELVAPEVTQNNEAKDLKYEWQVNYEVVGEDKKLDYVCNRLGRFPARLKIYNDDDAYFYEFKIQVAAAYEEGVLLLTESEGASKMYFKRIDKEGVPLFKEVYKTNNPNIPLGKTPNLLYYAYATGVGDGVYIGTSNPNKLYRINSKDFEVINTADYPGAEMKAVSGFPYFKELCFVGGNKVYNYDMTSNVFLPATYNRLPEGAEIANVTAFSYNVIKFQIGYAFFEKTKSDLWLFINLASAPYKISSEELKGKEVISIQACSSFYYDEFLVHAKDKQSGSMVVYQYTPIDLPAARGGKAPFYKVSAEYPVPEGNISENTVFLMQRTNTILYYSQNNKVYNYNYLSNSYAAEPVFAFAEGEKVKAMAFNENQQQIFIATNSTENNAIMYCYNLTTKKLVWKEENIDGKVASMIFKGKY